MKKQMLVLAAAVASAMALGSAPGAESVVLTVDIAEVKQDVQAPVRGGVPLARGKVASPDNIRALMDGREIDLQARKLASWPDGSVKWALLDFVAKNGDKVTVEFGADVKRREPAKGIAASAEADAITVDSGSVRLVVRRSGTAFIDELAFDANGDGRYDAAETVFAASAPGERRNFLDFVHRPLDEHYATLGNFVPGGQAGPSGIEITELSLEEKGPMRAVILIRGKHKVARLASRVADQIKYEGQSDFTVRIHAYRGLPIVTAEVSFVFDGVGDDDFVRAWGLSLPVEKGMKFTTSAAGGLVAVTPGAQAPRACLTQDSADSFRIWTADADSLGQTVVGSGERSAGWIDLSAGDRGMTVGIRRFWEKWPNALHYDSAAGRIGAMLYPPECLPMDLRNYTRLEWGVGETGAPEQDLNAIAPFQSKGTGNTKELIFIFRRGELDQARTESLLEAFRVYALAKAPPSYYSSTRALGYWAPKIEGEWDGYEQSVAGSLKTWLDGQRLFRWYGMFDYGDYQQRFGGREFHKHGRWENDWGRWGWGHGDGQGRVDRTLLMEYLRTGERIHFEQGEAMNRHRSDSDMCKSREFPWDWSVNRKIPPERTKGPWWDLRGCAHRHGVLHWSGPYLGARGGCPMGHRVYYYLTGDGRCADMLDIVAEMGMTKYGWGGYEKVTQRLGHSGGADGLGTSLQGILIAWERTGDKRYGDALKASFTDKSCQSYGLMHPKGSWDTGMTTAFGTFQALEEFADLADDAEARKILIDNAIAVRDDQALRKSYMWSGAYIPIVAAAYRFEGDESLGKLLREMIDTQVKKGVDGGNDAPAIASGIEALRVRGGK